MEPAASIISKLGGPAKVAEVTGTSYTSPYRWQRSLKDSKDATDGRIPERHIPALIAYAKSIGVPLTVSDFFPMAEAAA